MTTLLNQARVILPATHSRVWNLLVAAGAGLLLGGLLVQGGPLIPIAALAAAAYLWVAGSRPEACLLLLLALCSALIPPGLNVTVKLLVVRAYLADLLVLPLLLVVGLRTITGGPRYWRATPLDWPLLLLLGATVGGMLTAWQLHGVPLPDTTYEARFLLYYASFFVVTNLVRRPSQLKRLLGGVVTVSVALSLVMIAQGLGVEVPYASSSLLRTDEGVARLFHPGSSLVFITLLVLVSYLMVCQNPRSSAGVLGAIALLGTAVAMALSRNTVIAGAAALALGFVVLRDRRPTRIVGPALLLAAAASILIVLEASGYSTFLGRYLTAYASRMGQLVSADGSFDSGSLEWRAREIGYAWPLLKSSPIVGLGFSVPYRPAFYQGDRLARYIHNAYLWLWLKGGLPALVAFLWMSYRYLNRALRSWRQIPDDLLKAVVVGGGLAFLSDLISNVVAPTFVQDWGSAVYPLLLGVSECALLTAEAPRPVSLSKRSKNG